MNRLVLKISLLLLGSGFCALVYQVAWLRLLRLTFGASTAATAAVVAIFMAGLGFGSLLLGPKADRKAMPLAFYGNLELGISLAAATSPLLVALVGRLYIALGGTLALGVTLGTLLRLLLATVVLGVPTFLMGGTLPAAARAVERTGDRGRRLLGVLYGFNTLGALTGALATTFFSLEVLGIRRTIWLACLVNLLVALTARSLARRLGESDSFEPQSSRASAAGGGDAPPVAIVLLAAALVGFVFFLMELVWYRMMAPLLGGSSYTFGLILAMALLGIGIGGLLYGAGARDRRPTLLSFAGTCGLEALLVILPFALGDRLALLASVLRSLDALGFAGLALSWTALTALVVLPPALVAGYQFPLLVAVLGSGRRRVGREVGLTYAWNTAGAIAGSLAGGFGLLPLLSAPGAWRVAVLLLVALAVVTALPALRRMPTRRPALRPLVVAAVGLILCAAPGPTAFWRHSPIGAGRSERSFEDPNDLRRVIHRKNRSIVWQADGLESSVALQAVDGYTFVVNGKADGNARGDSPTQVMSGLLAAALHPEPRRALVIGLGTGSSAGWLAEVPTMERVDVVEIEPAIRRVAEACHSVNQNALSHPKVRLLIADGREVLLTSREEYDVIFSEPSNPYRAGIASLFSREFYLAAADRLSADGLFVQWLQAYEVDAQVVRTAIATLRSVFPQVETWEAQVTDLLLVAGKSPIVHDAKRMESRLAGEPYDSAMRHVWGMEGLEGFYSAYISSPAFADAMLEQQGEWINTDDRPIIEFGFARNVGRTGMFSMRALRRLAGLRGEDRPAMAGGRALDWERIRDLRSARSVAFNVKPLPVDGLPAAADARLKARQAYVDGDLRTACELWLEQDEEPHAPIDQTLVAECLAEIGDERAPEHADRLRRTGRPVEAAAVLARWHRGRQQWDEAGRYLEEAFEGYRSDPWPHPPVLRRALATALEVGQNDVEAGRRLFRAAREPFAAAVAEELRLGLLFDLSRTFDQRQLCAEALEPYEPWIPWEERFLRERLVCYERTGHPLARRARSDLQDFLALAPPKLERGLLSEAGS